MVGVTGKITVAWNFFYIYVLIELFHTVKAIIIVFDKQREVRLLLWVVAFGLEFF